jgi:DNA-binding CsgD family transcriptional regulator
LERAEAFLKGYLDLCGADFLAITSASSDQGFFSIQGGLMLGMQAEPVSRVHDWYFPNRQDRDDPFNRALWLHRGAARCRRDLISDRDWYGHEQVAEGWRWVGLDDVQGSALSLPQGTVLLAGMREWDSSPFGPRERELHHCLTVHFGWLFRELLDKGHLGPRPDGLPRHLQAVLDRLLRGRSEKGIAQDLQLSPRTVNKYVEKILRFHGVSSRSELMALWISNGPSEALALRVVSPQ